MDMFHLARALPILSVCLLAFAGMSRAAAPDEESKPSEAKPPGVESGAEEAKAAAGIERGGDGSMKLGLVTFDPASREIRFPAWVNMPEGMIEFPVAHRNGRLHEAIYATDALPLHIETVLRLLRYVPSDEVFPTWPGVDIDNPPPWDEWPEPVFPPSRPAAHVQCFAVWKDENGETIERDIRTQLVRAGEDLSDPAELPGERVTLDQFAPHWVFTGTTGELREVVPELAGCIVGVLLEKESIINTVPGGNIHEHVWQAHSERIASQDIDITIVIRPASPAESTTRDTPQQTKP